MRSLAVLFALVAFPVVLFAAGTTDTAGNYRLYQMKMTNYDCPLPPAIVPVDIEFDCRNTTVTTYQATGSITFGPGFVSEDGATFVATIVPAGYGVPQATNLTGTADANINWIQATVFDENGNVIGDSKQFFDASGKSLQSQNKVFYRAGASTSYTHVMASQVIRDAYGRDAAKTLPAPIDYADFSYRPNFLLHNTSGAIYNHQNFDLAAGADKTNSPDVLWDINSATPVKGTLAWYYSQYNNWEPYAAETAFPYSRQTWYQDGTGNVKKSAAAGDVLRTGQGREQSSYITPVANELDFYLQVRNKFFATTEVGALPTGIQGQAMQTITRDANGAEAIVIQDRSGKTLLTARTGTDLTVSNTVTVNPSGSGDNTIWYFKLLTAGAVTISGSAYTLYDMNTEQPYPFTSGNTLPAGYYKVSNTGTGTLSLTYANGYSDLSYSFFDQKGQMLASIAPEGVKKLYGAGGAGLGSYATRTDVPFITLFTYDVQGRMLSSEDKDGGHHQFIYRMDGKLRFSQNALQAISGSFTYTNYDRWGRITEAGQYQPGTNDVRFNTPEMTAILETTIAGGGLTGTKTDVIFTQYDVPDQTHPLSSYIQDVFNLPGAVSLTKRYSTVVNNSPSATNLVSATWYNYNEEGKIVWKIRYIDGLGYKTTDYSYDVLGNLTKRTFQANTPESFAHIFDYDPASKQLWHVYTVAGTGSSVLQATYSYNLNGAIRRVELAGNLQGVDYAYTLQGALKAINNSNKASDPGGDGGGNGFPGDAFGEVLDYYTADYVNTKPQVPAIKGVDASAITTDSYAGNIKAMSWYSEKPVTAGVTDAPNVYIYKYDPRYQFTESTWGSITGFSGTTAAFNATGNNKEKIGDPANGIAPYDGNGNIQYLQRTDMNGAITDQLTYNYKPNTNQLDNVKTVVGGVQQTYATYTYDERGQATAAVTGSGTQKYMSYDVAGRVTGVYRQSGNSQQVAGFVYDETGQRIKKLKYNSSGGLIEVDYYIDGIVYTQPVTSGTPGSVTVQEYPINTPNRIGVWYAQSNVYAYELDDHLGNVRAVIARSGSGYDVRMYTDYYPYGMAIGSPNGTNDYRYGYQGQNAEKDPETDWNAFELRMYDSRIGRWLQYDPKAQYHSPYMGMGNNPVSSIDKDGGLTSPIYDLETGDYLGVDDQGFKGDILFMSKAQYSDLSKNGTQVISHSIAEMSSYKIGDFFTSFGLDKFLPWNQHTADILDNAFTDIVSKTKLPGFKMGDILNSKVSTYGAYPSDEGDGSWNVIGANNGLLDMSSLSVAPAAYSSGRNTLTYNLNYMELLNTVENVGNLAVHEIEGHKIDGYNESVGKHQFAYLLQMNDPTFKNTTLIYQMAIRQGYQLAIQSDYNFNHPK